MVERGVGMCKFEQHWGEPEAGSIRRSNGVAKGLQKLRAKFLYIPRKSFLHRSATVA